MRIVRLDLLAFGPFTEQSLDFGKGVGFHIVCGANEAGKSSSLRALRHLLYGIPLQSSDNFLHPYQNLRIGGVFESANGTHLEFIRRKGRTNTLRRLDDDAVFDESQLLRVLGGVDEATFSTRFGIDYTELRRGGESVACGGGDLGEILFAAGAGVAGLRKVQQRLEDKAGELFKATGSKPRINDALSKLKDARKAISEAQLLTSRWVEHDTAHRTAVRRQQEIDEELTTKRTEQNRFDRILKSLPLIAKFKELRETLTDVGGAKLLPQNFSADRSEAEANLKNARFDETKAREKIKHIEEELGRIEVPVRLLEHRTAIKQLQTRLGSYQKAADDRPGLVARRGSAQREAERHLLQIDRERTLDSAESLRLSKAQRQRLQELAGECQALIQNQMSRENAVRDLDLEIARVQEEIDRQPVERDVFDLDRAIRQAQKQGNLDAQLKMAEEELKGLQDQANVELARLPLLDTSLTDLEKLPVPPSETIDRFENELTDADDILRRRNEKVDELTEQMQIVQGHLDALHLEGEVPSEADLERARRQRDAGWELVSSTWREGPTGAAPEDVAAFVNEFTADGDLATAFRASIDHADSVADRLRREADRVAQKAKLTADLSKIETNLERTRQTCAEAKRDCQRRQGEWQSQWDAVGIKPLSPREMKSWRSQQQQLATMAAEVRKRMADVERLVQQIGSLRNDLSDCLVALDQPRLSDESPLSIAIDRCQEIAERMRQQKQNREQLVNNLTQLRKQHPATVRERDKALKALHDWRTNWKDAVALIGLGEDAKPSDANAVIETIDEIFVQLTEARSLEERILGIDDDADKFSRSVQQILQIVAPDLLGTMETSLERAVADLTDRLGQAEKDQTKTEGWQKQLQNLRGDLESANKTVEKWQGTIDELCQQAGCDSPEDLPKAEARSQVRHETESEMASVKERLIEIAAGTDLVEWITIAEASDADQLGANLSLLEESINGLEREKQEVSQSIGEHRNELFRMDGSGKAADAQIESEHLMASLRSDAEEYIRWRLASAVLSRAMERFREASQGPVLSRASKLFSTMTLGSFVGLRADFDEQGSAVLVGVRSSGETVAVSGMSDGTCDQLYLALRIALLESSLEGREPLPFVVDDILIMFDDPRAVAALQALAELSQKTQVIFFTHHEHLVELAQRSLDVGVVHVHRL